MSSTEISDNDDTTDKEIEEIESDYEIIEEDDDEIQEEDEEDVDDEIQEEEEIEEEEEEEIITIRQKFLDTYFYPKYQPQIEEQPYNNVKYDDIFTYMKNRKPFKSKKINTYKKYPKSNLNEYTIIPVSAYAKYVYISE